MCVCNQSEHQGGQRLAPNATYYVINPLHIRHLQKARIFFKLTEGGKPTASLVKHQLKQMVLIFGKATLQCLLPDRWGAADAATAEVVTAKSLRPWESC